MILPMEKFRNFIFLIIPYCLIFCCLFINPKNTHAGSNSNGNSERKEIKRSLESLRDIDYQTWQIVVYPSSLISNDLILRIVGYPGSLRVDHPTNLIVNSGIKQWYLKDITKKNKAEIETLDDAVAEFDLVPLISELDKNRPLRLKLPGPINDLVIPPYLVSEWRSLAYEND